MQPFYPQVLLSFNSKIMHMQCTVCEYYITCKIECGYNLCIWPLYKQKKERRGRDFMVVEYTTACVISAYHQ